MEDKTPRRPIGRRMWLYVLIPLLLVIAAVVYIVYEWQPSSDECMVPIEKEQSELLLKAYQNNLNPDAREFFPAYSISLCHFEILQKFFDEQAEVMACRFYFGVDNDLQDSCLIVCSVNPNGRNNTSQYIKSGMKQAGLCPRFCDSESTLTNSDLTPDPTYEPGVQISADMARRLISWYVEGVHPVEGGVRGFSISREQYNLMKRIRAKVDVSGFRLYFGATSPQSEIMMIIVGIDPSGRDITKIIFPSTINFAGLCPRFCDTPEGEESRTVW